MAEARTSATYQVLAEVMVGIKGLWPAHINHLKQFREDLSVVEGVVVYKRRRVVPVGTGRLKGSQRSLQELEKRVHGTLNL